MYSQEDKIEYFIEDLYDQQMNLLVETEKGFKAGLDMCALNITHNSGIGISKTMDQEGLAIYEMFVFITDEIQSYFANIFKQYSVGEPFTTEEIANYIDRMNGAHGIDTKKLCRPLE